MQRRLGTVWLSASACALVAVALANHAHADLAGSRHADDLRPRARHLELKPVPLPPDPEGVAVFLDRNGERGADGGVVLPKFGGGDLAWTTMVACVKRQFAPFRVQLVELRPMRKPFIHVHVGGLASMKGYEDATTNGIAPHDGTVIADADVYVFSQVGSGERDAQNLCRVATHEIGHALGLDHVLRSGEVMSYVGRSTNPLFTFLDADAPCGETEPRTCVDGTTSQSSYRKLVRLVGLRNDPKPIDPYAPRRDPAPIDPYAPGAR